MPERARVREGEQSERPAESAINSHNPHPTFRIEAGKKN